MPDLSIHTTWTCFTNHFWEMEITSLTDPNKKYWVRWMRLYHGPVQFDWTCTCPSFKIGGKYCKHIRKVQDHRCAWNSELEPHVQAEYMGNEPRCPSCGGPVEATKVAV